MVILLLSLRIPSTEVGLKDMGWVIERLAEILQF